MNRIAFCASLLLMTAAGSARAARPADPQAVAVQDAFRRIASSVKPAVVSIMTMHTEVFDVPSFDFFFGSPFDELFKNFGELPRERGAPRNFRHRVSGIGSGFIIDPQGYVLTNEHVVRGADKIKVTLHTPEEMVYQGRVIGKDANSDLAVVKIDSKRPLPHVRLNDSDQVRVGDWAIAIGSPFGLEQTVTVGIISAERQSVKVEDRVYSDFLQTDAAINRGNSGGPLVDIKGEVIGINTAIFAPTGVFSGVGFAIPSNQAKDVIEQLIATGRVVRGWMGVELMPVDEVMAAQFRISGKKGALVNRVIAGSPAEKAGLRRGDAIVAFDGKKIDSPDALVKLVAESRPGKKAALLVIRDGASLELSALVGRRP